MNELDGVILASKRHLQIIDESREIISRSKNIGTIISRFNVIFDNIDKLRHYEANYPALSIKPSSKEVEAFYKHEKEKVIKCVITGEAMDLLRKAELISSSKKQDSLKDEAILLLFDGKKELTDPHNIQEIDKIIQNIKLGTVTINPEHQDGSACAKDVDSPIPATENESPTKSIDINAMDESGRTLLHFAAIEGNIEEAKSLILQGAYIAVRDKDGTTPLHLAVWGGKKEVAELLIVKGTDINIKHSNGATPLHIAAMEGHFDLANMLIARGADVNAKDNGNHTPLEYAGIKKNKDLIKLLKRSGAR